MTPTRIRIASAMAFLFVILAIFYFWRIDGLLAVGAGCSLLVSIEFSRMVYKDARFNILFIVLASCTMFTVYSGIQNDLLVFTSLTLVMYAFILSTARKGRTVQEILALQGLTALGLIYCGILPGHIIKLLALDRGLVWFTMFLCIAFAGDTFAYFAGRKFGKHKLLEAISPKKTVEGAWAGLAASVVTGLIFAHFAELDFRFIVPVSLVTAALAQIGDLFESVIKRVSDVKDSGGILPGHGGMMDRLDGVYFSAPFFYFMAAHYSYVSNLWEK